MAITYTTNLNLQKPGSGDALWQESINANWDDLDKNHALTGFFVSLNNPATPDLKIDIASGKLRTRTGAQIDYAGATSQTMTASATNYVYINESGTVVINTSGFPDPAATPHMRIAEVDTNGSQVTAIRDVRTAFMTLGPVPYLVYVDWDAPGAESGNAIEIDCTVRTEDGTAIAYQEVFRIKVVNTEFDDSGSGSATISAKGTPLGTILAGSGTNEIKVQSTSAGRMGIKVTETAAATRYLHVRLDFGTRSHLREFESASLVFA